MRRILAVLGLLALSMVVPQTATGTAWTPCTAPTCPVTHGQMIDATWLNTYVINNTTHNKENQNALGGFFSGLSIGTHIDADKAASQILLRTLDRVVVDSGVGISGISAKTANITLSGCGGLDTGTEQVSTWYQIYLAHNSSSGATCLLLHRAKDYFEDETLDTDDATVEVRKSTGTRTALGQGVATTESGKVDFIDVELIKVGTVTGNVWVELQSDSSGLPSTTVLATSDKLNAANLTTSGNQWIRFIFRTPYTVTAATTYHVVVTGDWTASDANYIGWRCDTSSAAYANGTRTQLEGGTWNSTGTTTHDFSFKVYVTRNDTEVTMPASYDGKALIGWTYNKSSGDLYPFHAVDKNVIPLEASSFTHVSTVPTLVSLAIHIPPVPVVYQASIVATNVAWLMPVPHGFGTPSGTTWRQFGGGTTNNTVGQRVVPISTETQFAYAFDTTGTITIAFDSWRW